MQDHDKKYGWTVSLYEYESTIPTLWDKTKGARGTAFSLGWLSPAGSVLLLMLMERCPPCRLHQKEPGLLGGTEHEGVDRSRRWRDVQPLSLLVRGLSHELPDRIEVHQFVGDRELMPSLDLLPHRSNFEIADMDFFRSEPYSRYFDHLDRSGGFSYERWGGELASSDLGLMVYADVFR